jgi:hypothetical protein
LESLAHRSRTASALSVHFTPMHGWWLSLVERWFAELTMKQIPHGTYGSVAQLKAAIQALSMRTKRIRSPLFGQNQRTKSSPASLDCAAHRDVRGRTNNVTNHWDRTLAASVFLSHGHRFANPRRDLHGINAVICKKLDRLQSRPIIPLAKANR